MKPVYVKKNRTYTTRSGIELFKVMAALGATLQPEKCQWRRCHTIVTEDDVEISCGIAQRAEFLYAKLNELYDLKINLVHSGKFRSIYSVVFDVDHPFFDEKEEEVTEISDVVVKEVIVPTLVEEVTPEPITEVVELEEINWGKVSQPTFGKAKLIALAEQHGVTLNSDLKYKELVEEFKNQKGPELV